MVAQDVNLNGRSSRSTQDENIYENLKKAAQDGHIERLYKLIAEDQNIQCQFGKKFLFVRRHYTIAAEKGQTHFSMELLTVQPSLATKLTWQGFTPVHLALQNNHTGTRRITPLHHVARTGDAESLSELLFACSSSIEDLTIKCETAVHIAVKNQQLMAFKVLLGWLKRANMKEILDWKDEDGNTIFHIAASINQTENEYLARHLSKDLSFIEKQNNLLGLSNLNSTRDNLNTSNRHDGIPVMARLIVTATYQAGLSPPERFLAG
ncbi:hypothetical protein BRARA_I02548 [Brassica rapa]|uniref:Uncharacterized protein n=1 Tax=Brassica campestris TaxID=3711 RepID=A0A397Y7K9_BRACM|nr:hypothetical protein BRARA_I02548 [Brassica rapa]